MKNFNYNLLLATTAILSMSAMVANAEDIREVNVSVDIVPMTSLEVLQEPYIGRLVLSKDVKNEYGLNSYGITIDTNGQLVANDPTKGRILTNAIDGKLNVSCSEIDSNEYSVYLKEADASSLSKSLLYYYKCVDGDDNKALLKLKNEGATSTAYQVLSGLANKGGGELTGSFTVTVVYPVATSSSGE